MKNIETFITADGSVGLYNKELDEIYHDENGAKKEAFEKFVKPVLMYKDKPVDILDICYGIGYNTKTAIEYLHKIKSIDCLEIDEELVGKSYEFEFDEKINKTIEKNLKEPDFIHFYIDDARKTIKKLDKKYDIIFHDGFSPQKQAQLWSEEFIQEIAKHLKKDGIYATYNHSKPVLNALNKAGLNLGKTLVDDRMCAIVASFNPEMIKIPFSSEEMGELNTKSAITYKDKNLDLSHEQMVQNREDELHASTLDTLSHYKKSNQ